LKRITEFLAGDIFDLSLLYDGMASKKQTTAQRGPPVDWATR
jgi:hypothetical protein